MKETSEGNTPIHPIQRTRQRTSQQFEGLEEYDFQIDAQTGGLILRSHRETFGIQHLRLHQLNGNSTTIGSRTKVGILGDPHPRTQTCCPRIHLSTVKIHGGMVLPRNSTHPQVTSPKGIEPDRNFLNPQNLIIVDQDGVEEIGVKQSSYSQSLTHSAYDSAEGIATPPDSDIEDELIRKMLASPLYIREREENEGQALAYHHERESLTIQSSRNPEASGKPDAECVQKREANAQRTKACHSRRESVMTSSSRDLEVSGKLDAVFSCLSESNQNTFSERGRSNEPGNRFENSVHSVFGFADPANVGKSLLDGNKDHLLNQARSEIMKQERQVESLSSCISEFQQQTYGQRLESEDAHLTGILNLEERNLAFKKIIYEGTGASRDLDTKYTRGGRNDESTRITIRRILCSRIERKL